MLTSIGPVPALSPSHGAVNMLYGTLVTLLAGVMAPGLGPYSSHLLNQQSTAGPHTIAMEK